MGKGLWLSGGPSAPAWTITVAWTHALVYRECCHTVVLRQNLTAPALSCSIDLNLYSKICSPAPQTFWSYRETEEGQWQLAPSFGSPKNLYTERQVPFT